MTQILMPATFLSDGAIAHPRDLPNQRAGHGMTLAASKSSTHKLQEIARHATVSDALTQAIRGGDLSVCHVEPRLAEENVPDIGPSDDRRRKPCWPAAGEAAVLCRLMVT
jgi:hypothetical protein